MKTLPLLFSLAFAGALHAQQPAETPVQPVARPATESVALRLARLTNPEEAIVGALEAPAYRDTLRDVLLQTPEMADLERAFPGIAEFAVSRVHPIIVRELQKRVPDVQSRIGSFLAARLSEEEMIEAIEFFESDAGLHFVDLTMRNISFDGLADDFANEGEISTERLANLTNDAVVRTTGQLPPEELRAVIRFGMSPVGRKLNEYQPELQQLTSGLSNRTDPRVEALIRAELTSAVGEFVEQFDE